MKKGNELGTLRSACTIRGSLAILFCVKKPLTNGSPGPSKFLLSFIRLSPLVILHLIFQLLQSGLGEASIYAAHAVQKKNILQLLMTIIKVVRDSYGQKIGFVRLCS